MPPPCDHAPQHETKQRRDEEDECPDPARNPFHGGDAAGGLVRFFHGMARWGSRLFYSDTPKPGQAAQRRTGLCEDGYIAIHPK